MPDIEDLKQKVIADDSDTEALCELASAHIGQGELAEAEELARRALYIDDSVARERS